MCAITSCYLKIISGFFKKTVSGYRKQNSSATPASVHVEYACTVVYVCGELQLFSLLSKSASRDTKCIQSMRDVFLAAEAIIPQAQRQQVAVMKTCLLASSGINYARTETI